MLPKPIEQLAGAIFWRFVNDPEFHETIYALGLNIVDFIQVKTGNVNLHSPEEAIKLAVSTCLRKDKESQTKLAAFITGLYLQHKIERAAQVGGSLLKRFGKSWFPHIKDRELRFALEVDSELEDYLYTQILSDNSSC